MLSQYEPGFEYITDAESIDALAGQRNKEEDLEGKELNSDHVNHSVAMQCFDTRNTSTQSTETNITAFCENEVCIWHVKSN
jgi:hypothetical protein